jgi:hypothetical protein
LQVDRCEVAARGDALPEKCGLHSIAADAFRQANDIDKPTELTARKLERRTFETGHIREKGIVTHGGLTAESEDIIDSLQLNAAEGARQLRKPIVIARLGVVEPVDV